MKEVKEKKKIRRGSLIADVLIYTFFVVFSLLVIYPFWDTIVLSFSDPSKATSLGAHLWNEDWSISSYKYVFEEGRLFNFAYQFEQANDFWTKIANI